MAGKIYIHETITLTVARRKAYLEHFTDVWAPRSRQLNGIECFGVWGTNGSTGRWPEAIVMWEVDGYEAFARMMSNEFAHLTDDDAPLGDHYELYWASAPEGVVAKDGFDRLLVPWAGSPSLAEAIDAGISGAIYLHQVVTTRPGEVDSFLAAHEESWRPFAEGRGVRLVGSYRTMMRNDTEAIVVWALPRHDDFVLLDTVLRTSDEARSFWRDGPGATVAVTGSLLVGAPANPLDTGRRL